MRLALLLLSTSLASASLAGAQDDVLTAADKAAGEAIRADQLRARIRFLADDLLEGRGPASRGDSLTQLYIATEMEAMGLQPAAPDGSWFQRFDLVGVDSKAPATVDFRRGAETVTLKRSDDFIAVSGVEAPTAELKDAELVFVGYGIVAPEYGWDDYKGADLKGKVLVMMNNDPADDPKLFLGKTRLYYGRWDYKYEMAARQGAAGAIIIHTVPSAGYGWQVVQTSWSGEYFVLPTEPGTPQLQARMWSTEDAARRLVRLGGKDLDALRAAAEKQDFKPVPLGVTVNLALANVVKKKSTANVLGRLPGSDPKLAAETVLYTAHHDHLGIDAEAAAGKDAIYNGALDNATGVSSVLNIAQAMAAQPTAPRRSVTFAFVAAEEQGLLGAKYLAAHLPLPSGRIAANINVDGMNIWGRTKDLTMVGLGKSSLDDWARRLLGAQGRVLVADQFPDKGFFYRSDQFAFAKIGVPAAYFDAGTEVLGQAPGWGKEKQEEFEKKDYHQPSDHLRPDWNFEGAVEDARFYLWLGLKVANADTLPAWIPGDEFEAARKKALAEVR
jgi:Zn-dependent M28 family amino/carboxypeptidase